VNPTRVGDAAKRFEDGVTEIAGCRPESSPLAQPRAMPCDAARSTETRLPCSRLNMNDRARVQSPRRREKIIESARAVMAGPVPAIHVVQPKKTGRFVTISR